jgi:hypothetical protein
VSKKSVRTDRNGFFRLQVAPNDFIYAAATAYHYDTLRYSLLFGDTVTIFLSPSGTILPNVTVTSQYTKYQLDSMERKGAFEENRGHVLNAVSRPNSNNFGLGINLDRFFKKKYKGKKRVERTFKNTEERAYIDYRFSPKLVSSYTGLKGDSLRMFFYRYSPGYQWLRQHPTNDEVLFYINEKLKEYKRASQ